MHLGWQNQDAGAEPAVLEQVCRRIPLSRAVLLEVTADVSQSQVCRQNRGHGRRVRLTRLAHCRSSSFLCRRVQVRLAPPRRPPPQLWYVSFLPSKVLALP
jgi:hypothetical protein